MQLRMHCSKLNAHLFSLHIVVSPCCSCGHDKEDSVHYLLHCPLFYADCAKMLTSLSSVLPYNIAINVDLLLHGSDTLSKENNVAVFKLVHRFIEETGRL